MNTKQLLEEAKADKKNIVIEIYQGVYSESHNVPDGYKLVVIDWDALQEE